MTSSGSRALPRLFRKLVVGIALSASPQVLAYEAAPVDDDEVLGEVDRAIGSVLEPLVARALAGRAGVSELLALLLRNMHPLDATRSICEAALSPSAPVRRALCGALADGDAYVGRASVLHHLLHDADAEVRVAAARAARRARPT